MFYKVKTIFIIYIPILKFQLQYLHNSVHDIITSLSKYHRQIDKVKLLHPTHTITLMLKMFYDAILTEEMHHTKGKEIMFCWLLLE